MTIIEIHATASHRYYMRKTKAEILDRVILMMKQLGYSAAEMDFERVRLAGRLKDDLASRAMMLHREFPE